jgi:diguanylate cyclase (GGDEF)-like protein/PAS domain S-box-containing protein
MFGSSAGMADLSGLDDKGKSPRFTVFAWDASACISAWNHTAQALFGWSAGEVIGAFPPFILAADAARYKTDCARSFGGLGDVTGSYSLRAKNGACIEALIVIARAVQANGSVSGVSMIEDVTDRIAAERRMAMLESVVVNSADAVIVTEATCVDGLHFPIVYVNAAFTAMTGYTSAEAVGRTPRMLQGPGTDPATIERMARALQRQEPVFVEVLNYRKDGSEFFVEFGISPVRDAAGTCTHFIAIERDTTQRRALERYEIERGIVLKMAVCNEPLQTQLARIVGLLRGVIPGSMGTVMLLCGDQLVTGAADPQMPPAYLAAIDGVRIGPNVGSCGTAAFTREPVLCGDVATDERWADFRDLALDAGLRSCWSIPLFGTSGDVIGAFALYADRAVLPTGQQLGFFEETVRFASLVVERHRDRERLERMALHDPLTDLPNRKHFEVLFTAALDRARSSHEDLALGVLDIDRFKAINDAFGHHVGDELLRQIAQRLSSTSRGGDAIARMAGDEFFVLFPDLANRDDGVAAATRMIESFSAPFRVEGYEIFVRPSFGLAFFGEASNEKIGLFAAADKAMYAAKARGGGMEVATSSVDGSALRKLDLENDLRHALERGEFRLHYQMMFDLADGRAVGAEALIRWMHPRLGMIAPDDFIPLAEANGTIVPIGQWVIAEAARVARGWQDDGRDAFVTVNVSALQFDEPGLFTTVVDALERNGLEPRRLHLELTESLVMRNPSASAHALLQLKALGVRIVIDDFGTGYSSLAYLQRFSFDALKIDRAFVRGIGDEADGARSEQIVAAVVHLGKALGVTTIAEGVEDSAQYAFVQACGCTIVQGFLCARPVPATDLDWRPTIHATRAAPQPVAP